MLDGSVLGNIVKPFKSKEILDTVNTVKSNLS